VPISLQDLEVLLRDAFPDAEISIKDLAGDNDHYAANIIAKEFKNKTRVQQHQMVYAALKGKMGGELHALALQTSAPE
jgi:stress-induced morphogen